MDEIKYVITVTNRDNPDGETYGLFDSNQVAREFFASNFVDSDFIIFPITITDWE